MPTVSLYRLHTDALYEAPLQAIADRILQTNPNQEVYIYDIERDEDEVEMLKDALHERHEPDCECSAWKAERDYGDD